MLFYCFLNTFFEWNLATSAYFCIINFVVFYILEAILFVDINICLYNLPHFAEQHKLKINK